MLRDLNKNQVPCVFHGHGQFIGKILAVDPENSSWLRRRGIRKYSAVLRAGQVAIIAKRRAQKSSSRCRNSLQANIGGAGLYHACRRHCGFVQRREYFRIGAPLYPPYYGVTTLPDTRTLPLFDLSRAAWALLESAPSPTGLTEGARAFRRLKTEHGAMGFFALTPAYRHQRAYWVIDGKNETITTPRLSFRFP